MIIPRKRNTNTRFGQNKNSYAYIQEGQSNATGNAPIATLQADLTGVISNAFIFNPAAVAFQALQAGVNNIPNAIGGANFGMEMRLMKSLGAFYGVNQYLYKYTASGTQLAQDGSLTDWSPLSSGEHYTLSNTYYTNGKAVLPEQVPVRAYIWALCENDGQGVATCFPYRTNLPAYIAAKRAFYGYANLPFIGTRFSNNQPSSWRTTIQQSQDLVYRYVYTNGTMVDTGMGEGKVDNTYLINTDSYSVVSGDPIHYDAAGYNSIALAVVDIITNYLPQ